MIEAGRLQPDQLVRRTIPLSEAPKALVHMHEFHGAGVTVIAPFA
jgi:hypothetical protein